MEEGDNVVRLLPVLAEFETDPEISPKFDTPPARSRPHRVRIEIPTDDLPALERHLEVLHGAAAQGLNLILRAERAAHATRLRPLPAARPDPATISALVRTLLEQTHRHINAYRREPAPPPKTVNSDC